MPGKESGHQNGQDPCRSQGRSTSTVSPSREQSSLPGVEALLPPPARRRHSGDIKHKGNAELHNSCDRESQRGMQTDFFALSVRKTLPSGKRGRKILPRGRREVGAAAAPSRGADSREVTPGLWDVALQRSGGVTEKRGAQEVPNGREAAYAGKMVRSSQDAKGKSALASATTRRAGWGVLHVGAGTQARIGILRSSNFLPVLEMFMLGTRTKRFVFSPCFC